MDADGDVQDRPVAGGFAGVVTDSSMDGGEGIVLGQDFPRFTKPARQGGGDRSREPAFVAPPGQDEGPPGSSDSGDNIPF